MSKFDNLVRKTTKFKNSRIIERAHYASNKDESNNGLWLVYHLVTGERIILRKRGFTSKKDAEIAEAVAISEIIGYKGESKLPFTVFLLRILTSNEKIMGKYKNTNCEKISLWAVGLVVTALNVPLLLDLSIKL